jgi:hypothetical protein
MLEERSLCECCLTDCRDKETGARCYRQTGFRRHHLLRLAVQQEVTSAEGTERKGEQSRNGSARASRSPRDTPPEKFRRLNNGEQKRGKGRRAWPPKRVATWSFSAFDSNDKLVWLRATRITHQAAMRLGLPQSVTEVYQVRLRLSDQRFIL